MCIHQIVDYNSNGPQFCANIVKNPMDNTWKHDFNLGF